jgi:hypothetical protein
MTPKEKSKELFNYYHNLIQNIGGDYGQEILVSILAKECSLFLVREMLKNKWKYIEYSSYYFWEQVEYEIEKL